MSWLTYVLSSCCYVLSFSCRKERTKESGTLANCSAGPKKLYAVITCPWVSGRDDDPMTCCSGEFCLFPDCLAKIESGIFLNNLLIFNVLYFPNSRFFPICRESVILILVDMCVVIMLLCSFFATAQRKNIRKRRLKLIAPQVLTGCTACC